MPVPSLTHHYVFASFSNSAIASLGIRRAERTLARPGATFFSAKPIFSVHLLHAVLRLAPS